MVKTVTSINGRLVSRKDARISVFDNSLLYAEGLFETFLGIGDRLVFAAEHLDRLRKGARLTGIPIPVSPERLIDWGVKTLKAHPSRVKKLRLTLTVGDSARWVGRQGRQQVIFSAAPHQIPTEPFKLHVSEFRVDRTSEFRQVKTLSYAIHAAALKKAKTLGCDDALMLNQKGNIAEVTSANVYWIENGRVFTPPLAAGCLEGVTRRVVLREAAAIGHPITERRCPLERLLEADEVFISSSLKLVIPVGLIKEGRRVHRWSTGPVGQAFSDHIARVAGVR
ncbi:MAG TPA: aminotransferase class IV [candidate division Zixibacteria bacterium]|nr:aminotransferase class IV [candidate division Zixibacteria bacterium]